MRLEMHCQYRTTSRQAPKFLLLPWAQGCLKPGFDVNNAGKIQKVSENFVMRKVINFTTEVVVAGHFYSCGMQSLINQQRSKERHTELQDGSVADTKCAFVSPVSRARKIKFLWMVNGAQDVCVLRGNRFGCLCVNLLCSQNSAFIAHVYLTFRILFISVTNTARLSKNTVI